VKALTASPGPVDLNRKPAASRSFTRLRTSAADIWSAPGIARTRPLSMRGLHARVELATNLTSRSLARQPNCMAYSRWPSQFVAFASADRRGARKPIGTRFAACPDCAAGQPDPGRGSRTPHQLWRRARAAAIECHGGVCGSPDNQAAPLRSKAAVKLGCRRQGICNRACSGNRRIAIVAGRC
jgi:hypothetical protein